MYAYFNYQYGDKVFGESGVYKVTEKRVREFCHKVNFESILNNQNYEVCSHWNKDLKLIEFSIVNHPEEEE